MRDIQIKPAIFPGEVIIVAGGKLSAHPITWLLFHWLTITVRCWLGVLRSPFREESAHKGGGMPKIWEFWAFFRESHATMRLMGGVSSQNENFRGFCPGKKVFKTIF
jgi:hypothetical protein